MANIHDPEENIKVDVAVVQQTIASAGVSSTPGNATYFRMRHYDLVWFFVFTGTRSTTASLSCQMHQRIGVAGTPITLGNAVNVVTGDAVDTRLWARGEDMSVNLGHDRVGIVLTEAGVDNFVVGVLCLRLKARYKQATLLTT